MSTTTAKAISSEDIAARRQQLIDRAISTAHDIAAGREVLPDDLDHAIKVLSNLDDIIARERARLAAESELAAATMEFATKEAEVLQLQAASRAARIALDDAKRRVDDLTTDARRAASRFQHASFELGKLREKIRDLEAKSWPQKQ